MLTKCNKRLSARLRAATRNVLYAACYVLLLAGSGEMGAKAQVITSIGSEALKIPRGERPDTARVAPAVSADVKVNTDTPYFHHVDSAQQCSMEGDWAGAERHLLLALRAEPANPSNSMLLSNIATLQRRQGRIDEAIKNYNLSLDLVPNSVTVVLNRAALYASVDSLDRAAADYLRALELNPACAEALYSLGMIDLSRDDDKQAEDRFNQILRVAPNSGLSAEGLAALHKKHGNYRKAVEYLSEIIKVSPNATLLGSRADCYLMLRRLPDAAVDIQSALMLNPDDGYLYLLRAKLNKMRFNYDDMEADVERAVTHGVDRAEVEQALK
ncbi:MAG: tetratricopeptide repeat protein [Muribaculaceae bacterium]|nr:tetratricopeptide repeat protein [Muribaculaceae bacterium]